MGYRFGKLVGLPELPKYCGRVGYSTHCYAMSYQFGKLVGLPELGSSYQFRKCVASRATKYGATHMVVSATNVGAKILPSNLYGNNRSVGGFELRNLWCVKSNSDYATRGNRLLL